MSHLNSGIFPAGKSTGIVTNTRITHATPAALYGHSPSRYWEDDSKVPPASRKSCKDLARQLIENDPGRNINVSTCRFKPLIHVQLYKLAVCLCDLI